MTVPTRPATVDLIAEYAQYLRDELGRAPSTVDTYTGVLRHADRELPEGLPFALHDELRAWITAGGRRAATRSLYTAAIKGFFTWATDPRRPRLTENSATWLPRVPKPVRGARPLPAEDLQQILLRAAQPYLTWFTLALYAGARCIELAALQRRHITAQRLLLQGKGDVERYVATHPAIWRLVRDLPDGPVCVGAHGERLTRRQISRRGRDYLHAIGADASMHRFRHSFGTMINDEVGDLRVVQTLMGHRHPSTTATYVQASTARMQAAVAGLPDLA
ncbi:tyrosine-type recombinase/integrase [Mangrovihabitans endophyticus]|uniref:Tyrosine recombinase XerC n=1 Tax=Mangrovihabitans endophyticus TaxID=1751298 RepID=A0A8J3C354_9ACTN|nr:tyrosine-type recombinase/integrase [Mangrovihabitans endophyticus]GGL10645.1 tyrosine recombinase XerC [Mangrovihabitans endophyticus]